MYYSNYQIPGKASAISINMLAGYDKINITNDEQVKGHAYSKMDRLEDVVFIRQRRIDNEYQIIVLLECKNEIADKEILIQRK